MAVPSLPLVRRRPASLHAHRSVTPRVCGAVMVGGEVEEGEEEEEEAAAAAAAEEEEEKEGEEEVVVVGPSRFC